MCIPAHVLVVNNEATRILPPRAAKERRGPYNLDEYGWLLQDDVGNVINNEDAPGGTVSETEDESTGSSMRAFIEDDEDDEEEEEEEEEGKEILEDANPEES